MKYLSVCSGIESASVAWRPLDWSPVAFSEIEPFPCSVLAHHYPHVPNWGDMTRYKEWPDATVDVLVGGTPCQSFSVSGLRKGLGDPRGNLMLTYLAIAARYRPEWVVWENVPGVLSSGGGRDFGAFLGALGKLGYGFAYRVLDAFYFGCAITRPRVFVVGNIGGWQRASAALFESTAFCNGYERKTERARGHTLSTENAGSRNGRGNVICDGIGLRGMSIVETERCLGFADNYTLVSHRGKPASDRPRYKALGNSMAVPVMAWIGKRIAMVNEIIRGDDA